jgi:hypothetical protein
MKPLLKLIGHGAKQFPRFGISSKERDRPFETALGMRSRDERDD